MRECVNLDVVPFMLVVVVVSRLLPFFRVTKLVEHYDRAEPKPLSLSAQPHQKNKTAPDSIQFL